MSLKFFYLKFTDFQLFWNAFSTKEINFVPLKYKLACIFNKTVKTSLAYMALSVYLHQMRNCHKFVKIIFYLYVTKMHFAINTNVEKVFLCKKVKHDTYVKLE